MKIFNKIPSMTIASYRNSIGNRQNIEKRSCKNTDLGENKDKVALSPQAQTLHEADNIIASLPDIDQDKVSTIKEQLEKGTYKVDKNKIAENMINDAIQTLLIK